MTVPKTPIYKKLFFQELIIKLVLSFFCFCTFSLFTLEYLYAENQPAVQTEEIIVGGNFDYPPYEFINSNGIPTGYSTELTYALADVIGVNVRVELDSWKTTRDSLENGKIDAIHGMYYSKERDRLVDFSPPHTIIYNTIFTIKSLPDIKSLNELKGKQIVVVERGVLHDFLKENKVTDKVILTGSDGAALRLVSSGKYKYALLGKLPGIYLSKKLKLTNIKPTGPPILPFKYCFAVKEGNLSLLSRLNEGLAILKQTGQYQNIYDKWLGVYEPKLGFQNSTVKYFLIFFSTLIVFIAVGALWLKILKKQVSERTDELSREIGERKLAQKALLESEERLKAVLEGSQLGYWDWNIKTGEVVRNKQSASMLGYTLEEVKFNVKQWTDLHHPDDRDAAWKSIQDHLKGRTPEHKIEYRMCTKEGSYKWILDQAKIVSYDSDGNPLRMSGTHTDISERKKLERQLLQSQKLESIGNLAGGIAHEFNNILSIIIGNNELIMGDLPGWSHSRESCEEIRVAGLRARDIVKHLLTFSRQDDSTKKPIDTVSVVKESLKLIQATTPTNIEICDNISTECDPILGDATQINQILINLCNNAVDALPISGGKIDIKLCNSDVNIDNVLSKIKLPPGKYVKLLVRDNGSGVDKSIRDRIFEPYFTTKDIGKGSGIGLAVVHGIVENHGGSIVCDSSKYHGTTFTILIPAYDGTVEIESHEKDIYSGNGEKILYVDDEPPIAKLGRRHLEALGYDAYSITDPQEALEMIKAEPNRFNLVISDMAMPNMPGDQLITEILSINSEMPTMICSGYTSRMSETKASKMGIKAFVMKPLIKAELAKTVRDVLDGRSKQTVK